MVEEFEKNKGVKEMYKLIYVLQNIQDFKWADALFLPENEIWNKDTEGMVLDPDDVENDEDEIPKVAREKKLMYVLSIQIIKSIVMNAYQQKHQIREEELLEAFLYYYDNDAYINF